MAHQELDTQIKETLSIFGLQDLTDTAGDIDVNSPIHGRRIASVKAHKESDVDGIVAKSVDAFNVWRVMPAPTRGHLIRLFGDVLRKNKQALGKLVSIECGKIVSEGLGEVQEMIDICDYAVGLSRQLYGLTIQSERPSHHMREMWQPLGPVGVISAFNFPVAVWSWNTTIAVVCGDPIIWKPSEKTPLTAMACCKLFEDACAQFEEESGERVPEGLLQLLIGDYKVGEKLVDHEDVPLISATGSVRMGKAVAPRVAARLGRSLLELGGNNAMIVTDTADLDMAVRAILFGAVGTAGQRCTTTRRLFVHDSVYDTVMPALQKAYDAVRIGNPLDSDTLVGPLIDKASFDAMEKALEQAKAQGGEILAGGGRYEDGDCGGDAYYARPALVAMPDQTQIVKDETFAPILYVMRYTDYDDALFKQNDVPQGLSSAVFTMNVREAERFLSAGGSDCGIANVNIGTSGAEIGGAFGGEKETGGGRESGSDAWKVYMRRQTQTINYSSELPLAQGVSFDL